jgi:hypothetical protein
MACKSSASHYPNQVLRTNVREKPVTEPKESRVEAERREWVERYELFKDLEERYGRQRARSTDPAERRKLAGEFAAKRRAHREMDIALGKRSPSTGVAVRQTMWLQWLEIAVRNEMVARRGFQELITNQASDPLGREFRASLIAVTASSNAIEAIFGEVKYLIPPQPRRDKRHNQLRHAFRISFGIAAPDDAKLYDQLATLFSLRDSAVHPYTELVPTEQHPAGINTGVEHSLFNAVTSGSAVETAITVIQFAAAPPKPFNYWIARWAAERVTPALGAVGGLQQLRVSEPLQRQLRYDLKLWTGTLHESATYPPA